MAIVFSTRALRENIIWYKWALRIGLPQFVDLSLLAGYCGISFMPIGKMAYDLKTGLPEDPVAVWIKIIEQPYRSEESLWQILAYLRAHITEPKALAALLPSLMFVMGRRESLAYLAKLAQNRNVPAVIYPYHAPRLPEYDSVNLGGVLWNENPYPEFEKFPVRLVRPTNGLKADDFWAFDNPKDFWKIAQQYGYTGISLNIGDLLSMYPNDWAIALWGWLEHVKKVEIDANRLTEPEYAAVLGHFRRSSAKLVIYRIPGRHPTAQVFFEQAEKSRLEVLSRISS